MARFVLICLPEPSIQPPPQFSLIKRVLRGFTLAQRVIDEKTVFKVKITVNGHFLDTILRFSTGEWYGGSVLGGD